MRAIRCLLAVILFAISGLLAPAWATSFSTDQSDLWWIPAESGWGMQLVQRGSVIFATMFVYDSSNTPIWYVATMQFAGNFTWTGDLYVTTGPYFGTMPFNPANVVATKVGTMTWTAQTVTTGMLTYNVGDIAVVKNVTRQALVFDDFSGHYAYVSHRVATGCFNPAFNGTGEFSGILNITQNGQAITLQTSSTNGTNLCSYPGTLSQAGQMGDIVGSYTCFDGTTGPFDLFEVQVNTTEFTARFMLSGSSTPGCQVTGWIGGVRVTTF